MTLEQWESDWQMSFNIREKKHIHHEHGYTLHGQTSLGKRLPQRNTLAWKSWRIFTGACTSNPHLQTPIRQAPSCTATSSPKDNPNNVQQGHGLAHHGVGCRSAGSSPVVTIWLIGVTQAETNLDWQKYFPQIKDTTDALPCHIHLPVCLWVMVSKLVS